MGTPCLDAAADADAAGGDDDDAGATAAVAVNAETGPATMRTKRGQREQTWARENLQSARE